jgi:hypothetical protein
MDRLNRSLFVACGFGLMLSASGCRSPRSEVPPGRQYQNDGREVPPVGFSASPRASMGTGMPGDPTGSASGTPPSNTTAPSSMTNYGTPTGHGYGPPVTAMPGAGSSSGSSGSLGLPGTMPPYGGTTSAAGSTPDPNAAPAGTDPLSAMPPGPSSGGQTPFPRGGSPSPSTSGRMQ